MALKACIIGLTPLSYGLDRDSDAATIRTHAKAYLHHERTDLVGVADTNPGPIEDFIEYYPGVNAYTDPVKMMELEKPDIVSLCSWPDTHARILSEILPFKPKAIFCEKPISFSLTDASQILNDCLANDIELIVNYPRRFDSMHQEIAVALQHGLIGNILGGSICYARNAVSSASEVIDLARQLLGNVQRVQAFTDKDVEGFDANLNGRLVFGKESNLFLMALEPQTYPYFDVQLFGSLGNLQIFNSGQECTVTLADANHKLVPTHVPFSQACLNPMYSAVDHVVDVAESRLQNLSGVDNAMKTLHALLCLQKSHAHQGEIITLSPEARHLNAIEIFQQL